MKLAHTAICVPDIKAATEWYSSVLGLTVLSPPFLMEGDSIERDMGELLPAPAAVTAAILGNEEGDRVIELVEYPNAHAASATSRRQFTDTGLSHIGLVCDDIEATRAELESRDVEFLTTGAAKIAGLHTAWFRDPWGVVWILLEKRKRPDRAYWRQFGA